VRAPLPVWRSILYVPVNVDRFVEKAHLRGADALLLDLEDSIAVTDKESARQLLPRAIEKVTRGRADIGVRINRPLDLAVRDIEAAVRPGVSFLSLPKVEGAGHVRLLSELVADLEHKRGLREGAIRFIVLVETAASFSKLGEIAGADPRVVGLALGSEDFALSCGMQPSGEALTLPKQMAVIAARAAGILPLGIIGSIADFADMDSFRAVVRRSSAFGLTGSFAIHPDQVPVLNEEFAPSPEAIVEAKALLAAAKLAMGDGLGAFAFKGRMIDKPIVQRAATLLVRAAAVAARTE